MVLNPKLPLHSCYSVNKLNYWRKYKFVIICQASANKMDYIIEEYKRSFGKVFTSVDGNIYIQSKHTEKYIFLKKTIVVCLCVCPELIGKTTSPRKLKICIQR